MDDEEYIDDRDGEVLAAVAGKRPNSKGWVRGAIVRFFKKVRVDPSTGCWVWQGKLNEKGYGRFCPDGKTIRRAHVASYELHVGEVPRGLVIDHVCRNRACVNPDVLHLEAVTQRVNLLRGDTFTARNAAKTHCPAGHQYAGDNLYVDKVGRRYCKACRRSRPPAWYQQERRPHG